MRSKFSSVGTRVKFTKSKGDGDRVLSVLRCEPASSLSPQLQALIGAKNAIAFDLTAACSGFIVGLITASQFIQTGAANKILLIGADALSRYVDWTDRRTSILFGDGAGAVVMEAGMEANHECNRAGWRQTNHLQSSLIGAEFLKHREK